MYKILFEDGSSFKNGQDLERSGWNDMPNKIIVSLTYSLGNKTIKLSNFEAYCHLVERQEGVGGSLHRVSKVIILAKYKNEVISMIYNLLTNRLYKEIHEIGKEYNEAPITGWKLGIMNKIPEIRVD